MSPSEPFSNLPNTSEVFGNVQNTSEDFSYLQKTSKRTTSVVRGKKYPGAEIPDNDFERGNYSLVMEEVYSPFAIEEFPKLNFGEAL